MGRYAFLLAYRSSLGGGDSPGAMTLGPGGAASTVILAGPGGTLGTVYIPSWMTPTPGVPVTGIYVIRPAGKGRPLKVTLPETFPMPGPQPAAASAPRRARPA